MRDETIVTTIFNKAKYSNMEILPTHDFNEQATIQIR